MPYDVTLNDELNAKEAEFIADFAARNDGKPETAAPAPTDPPTTAEAAPRAEAGAPTPTPAVSAPAKAGDVAAPDATAPTVETAEEQDPATASAPATGEETDEDDEPVVTDEAFQAAMAAERASLSLDGVPEEARPVVQKKIKDLEAGFTRSMQKLAAERKAAAEARAEARFQQERPVDFITELLVSRPELMDQVNAKLSEFEASPTAREAHGVIVERAREKARTVEQEALAAEAAKEAKALEVTRMAKAAARAAGVPWEMGVEAKVAAHLAIHGDITEAEVRDIATDAARVWKRHLREQERTKANAYVQEKVKDRKTAGLVVKPASGAAPTPAPRPTPKTDDEFIAQFVASGR